MTDLSEPAQLKQNQDVSVQQIILLRSIEHHLVDLKRNQELILDKLSTISEIKEDEADYGSDTTVKGIDLPFSDMVWLILKWFAAAIPAGLIIGLLYLLIFYILI